MAVGARVVCFLFLVLCMALCLSCDSASGRHGKRQEYITIGALFPLTGVHCDDGIRAFNGLQQVRREINDAGGVLGKKLDIIVLDDKSCEEYVVKQYRALVERGAVAIVGSSFSNVTLALAKASEADGIPVISPTASNPVVTEGRRNVFRVIYVDDEQAVILAEFAKRALSAKTALIIRGDDRYEEISDVFANAFKAGGGRVLANERFADPKDFDAILAKHKRNQPDVIFSATDYVVAARLAEAVYNAGFDKTNLLGTDAWDGILSFAHKLDAMERVYYASPFAFDEPNPKVARFSQAYFDNFSYTPVSTAALTYSAVQILAAAMEKSGGTGADGIINAMRSSVFDIVTGKIQFDENNNPNSPEAYVHIMEIKDGYYSSVESIRIDRGAAQ